jgi:hypothetical protein
MVLAGGSTAQAAAIQEGRDPPYCIALDLTSEAMTLAGVDPDPV